MDEEVAGPTHNSLSATDTAKLLLDEWKFRQAHCWRLLRTYGLAAVGVSIAPAISNSLVPAWNDHLRWIIGGGFALQMGVVWLFYAEYVRCHRRGEAYSRLIGKAYKCLIKDHDVETKDMFRKWEGIEKLGGGKIGRATPVGLIVLAGAILVGNLLVFK